MNQPRPVPPTLRTRLDRLKYTPAISILRELHGVGGGPLNVLVIGSLADVSYEWVLTRGADQVVATHSDDGYASADVALRDGLIAALGVPDNFVEIMAKGATA